MNAAQVMRKLRGAGATVSVDGDSIVLEASTPLPLSLVEDARLNKAGIAALCRESHEWDAEDWRALFDEAAGAAQFDNGLSPLEAEEIAFECCITEWLNRNFMRSPPGRCLGCHGKTETGDQLLPFGTERTGHAWLRARCWPGWQAARTAEAISALARLGVSPRSPDNPSADNATRRNIGEV
jgi:hypothetical protein